jgi:hypothetical protein
VNHNEDAFFAGFTEIKTAKPPARRAKDAQRLDWLLQPHNRTFMHNLAQTNATANHLRELIDREMG